MEPKCPGRTSRNLKSEIRVCPQCRRPVEMFSDEEKVRCKCGQVILREAVPCCIQWCAAAEKCLAGVLDVKELRRKLAEKAAAEPDPEFFKRVSERIRRKGSRARGRRE